MNRLLHLFTLLFLFLSVQSQDFSNKGKEFWVGYGSHVAMYEPDSIFVNNKWVLNELRGLPKSNGGSQSMVFYFSSDRKAKVKVEIPQTGWFKEYDVFPGVIRVSDTIPKQGFDDARILREGKSGKGIHIISDIPIIAYAHIYNQNVSGATLLYPVNVLSNVYYSLNMKQSSNDNYSYSYCFVVATEDNTEIEIIPSVNTFNHLKNSTIKIILNKGEIYNIFGSILPPDIRYFNGEIVQYNYNGSDLSGTVIRSTGSCKKIAVFAGSGKINLKCDADRAFSPSADNLIQQCLPADAWGKKYLVVPTKNMQTNLFRVLVKNSSTIVKRDGVPISSPLVNNSYYEFITSKPEVITSDNDPIMVAQYITTTGQCDNILFNDNDQPIGDPEMIYLSPVEQSIDKVTINSTSNYRIIKHYLNIVIPKNGISSLKVDGIVQTGFNLFQYDLEYAYIQIELSSSGSHTISADIGFNAIAYGYGVFESYGYNAGSSVKNLNQYITTDNVFATVKSPATCQMTPFNLSLTLPYKPLSINWDFNNTGDLLNSNGTIAVNPGKFSNPAGGTMIPDEPPFINPITGKELYTYNIPGTYKYKQSNLNGYQIAVSVEAPLNNNLGCSGLQEIIYDVIVYNPPKTGIDVASSGCINSDILFKSEDTIDIGMQADRYIWTFDGVDQNPIVTNSIQKGFGSEGNHIVGVKVITDIGCISPSFDSIITVSNIPNVDFLPNPIRCNGIEFDVIDKSTLSGLYKLVKWDWKLDEKPEINNSTPNSIKYTSTSDFAKIKLTVSSETGCKNTIEKNVQIFPNPEVAFTLPNFCLKDGEAEFTSLSSVSINSLGKWEWNFGDQNTASSFPVQRSGEVVKYPYSKEGDYPVTLTVTSIDGCVSKKTQTFTVNGAIPKPIFDVVNEANLCSNNVLKIINKSEVNIGTVGQVDFYFDYANKKTPDTIDTKSKIGSEYIFKYQNFRDESMSYTLRMVAYSGKSCFDIIEKPITVYGSPVVTLNPIPSACSNGKLLNLPIPKVLTVNNTNGIGKYLGQSIVEDFKFDPGKLDSGNYKISYRYTTAKGCYDQKDTIVRVNFTPKINAGPDIQLLEDSTIKIKATAIGVGLAYQWLPSDFLSSSTILNPDIVQPQKDIAYVLVVTGSGNCISRDTLKLTTLNILNPPNTLLPGRPPYDKWVIDNIQKYKGCKLKIFDVNGRLIKSYENGYDNNQPWNGTRDKTGEYLPAGTYYYILDPKNGRKIQTGYVTILR